MGHREEVWPGKHRTVLLLLCCNSTQLVKANRGQKCRTLERLLLLHIENAKTTILAMKHACARAGILLTGVAIPLDKNDSRFARKL